MCVNCGGPHEAHSTTCTKRPIRKRPGEEDGEDDEVEVVGTTQVNWFGYATTWALSPEPLMTFCNRLRDDGH